jgi:prepilin-type N-terminal cleavage/methylation domain-containing protein
MKNRDKGFTLIELLIVVAIILIIAAIAIPKLLRSKMAANEASAVGSLRTITTPASPILPRMAMAMHPRSGAWRGAATVAVATCAAALLIDSVLSAAGAGTSAPSRGTHSPMSLAPRSPRLGRVARLLASTSTRSPLVPPASVDSTVMPRV